MQLQNTSLANLELPVDKVLSQSIWETLQKEAKDLLENNTQGAHPEVIAHWQSIVDGNVLFGYMVKKDD